MATSMPRMPPEDQVRSWLLVYYSKDRKLEPVRFWKEYGKEIYERYKSGMKVNDEVRKAAAEIIGDATAPEQKLERLFEFCRTKIKNIYDDALAMTDADRAKVKENKSPSDTLKRGMGTSLDIDMLFASLATAAGFDVRVANLADRSDIFFDPNLANDYFLNSYMIAVRVGDQWKFFDTANTYLPIGMLKWKHEGQQALICDAKDPIFVPTPLSPPEKSLEKRTAKLRLGEDGTLEGNVRIEYTGHLADDKKEYNDDDSAEQREQTLLDMIKKRMSTAEIANIKIENVTDPVKPFVYSFDVRVPGYAQRTGKRLFLQPAFFQHGVGSLFPTSERKHTIYFHYPWMEDDTVEIELPAGFALDNAESPQGFNVQNVGKYDVKVFIKDGRTLVYKRGFHFGANGNILFPSNSYANLKRVFDILHEQDNHTITLKQGGAASN